MRRLSERTGYEGWRHAYPAAPCVPGEAAVLVRHSCSRSRNKQQLTSWFPQLAAANGMGANPAATLRRSTRDEMLPFCARDAC